MGNDSNWPPLEISGCRVRAGYAYLVQDLSFEVRMPATKGSHGSSFSSLFARLNDQSRIPVLFSRAVSRPEDVGKPAKMCGGRFADPEGYLTKIAYIDVLATAGNRIDLEIMFFIDQKMPTCAYTKEDPVCRVMTWEDLKMHAKRPNLAEFLGELDDGSIDEVNLRLTPGLATGYFVTGQDLWTRGETGHTYDLDEYEAQVWIGDIKVK
jgi:hypothetical protein